MTFLPSLGLGSIRARLAALVGALAVPFTVLYVWSSVREYRLAVRFEERTALTLAEAAAVGVRQFVAQAEAQMTRPVERSGAALLDPLRCPAIVEPLADVLSYLSNALVVDAGGRVVCAADAPPEDFSGSLAAAPWFERVRASASFTVGSPSVGPVSGRWLIGLAAPVLDEGGEFRGALAGSVDLAGFQERLGLVRLEGDELLTIVTSDGTVVARSRDPERWVGRKLGPDTASYQEVVPRGLIARAADLDGVRRAFGKVDIPELGWRAMAGVPVATARSAAVRDVARRIALGFAFLLVATLLAIRLHRGIAGSLGSLRDGARVAAAGVPVSPPAGALVEVLEVARQLNAALDHRSAAEEAERAARERYQGIFDHAVFGIYVSTEDGRFLDVNPALATMLGYGSTEDLRSTKVEELYADPEGRRALVERYGSGGSVEDLEVTWRRRDGSPIRVRLNGRAIRGADGGATFQMIVEDVTEEHRKEEELRHHQKMEAVGQLAGGIAHDFNNLLTVIGGHAELLQERLADGHPAREDVERVLDAADRAACLTRQLLSFGRKARIEPRRLDVNELVEGMRSLVRPLVGVDVVLETRLAPGLVPAHADRGGLEQVVMNLVLNARDALPRGGCIRIETRNLAGGRVELSVTDDGVGMPPEVAARVFEPFFTTKAKGRGTGLGLANVYGIVRQNGGHVRVDSAPGRGTTFTLELPAWREERPPARVERRVLPRAGRAAAL